MKYFFEFEKVRGLGGLLYSVFLFCLRLCNLCLYRIKNRIEGNVFVSLLIYNGGYVIYFIFVFLFSGGYFIRL